MQVRLVKMAAQHCIHPTRATRLFNRPVLLAKVWVSDRTFPDPRERLTLTVGRLKYKRLRREEMNSKPITYTFWAWSRDSATLGAKTGCVLSILYMSLFVLGVIAVGFVIGDFRNDPIGRISGSVVLFGVVGSIIGVIPSAVVGTLTALCISTLFWPIKRWLSTVIAIIMGSIICFGFVALVEYFIWSRITDRATGIGLVYGSWSGLPTRVYIVAGGYMGWKLFKILSRKKKISDELTQTEDSEKHIDIL